MPGKKKIKVSIVEDLDELRQGFEYLINSSADIECIAAYSSAESILEDIEKNLPDVIIMDIGLPEMSGIECTREIKLQKPSIEILICTIYEDDDRLFNALAAGASGYILKNTASKMLLDSIRDVHGGGAPMTSLIARKVIQSLNKNKKNNDQLNPYTEDLFKLSNREKEILTLIANGYRNKEISEQLFISLNTVKTHVYKIYEKLHVKSRMEIVKKYPTRN